MKPSEKEEDSGEVQAAVLDFPALVSGVHQNWLVLLHFFANAGTLLHSSAELATAIPRYVTDDRIDMDLVTLLHNLRTDMLKLKTDLAVCAAANENMAAQFMDLRRAFEVLHEMNQLSFHGFGHA